MNSKNNLSSRTGFAISSSVLLLVMASSLQADIIIPKMDNIKNQKTHIDHCNQYATTAVKQFSESQSLGCGFSGSRWNNNLQGQLKWCLSVLEPFSREEQSFRQEALASCQKEKTSSGNPQNKLTVPQVCNDPTKMYQAVKSINHHYRYETKLTIPVENGLIRYDYNRDGKPDYVFLEARDSQSRIAMCFSQGQSYRRQLTDISIYSDGGVFGSYNYKVSQLGDRLNITIDYFEHNAGSSFAEVSYRFNTQTRKFAIVSNNSNVAPVIYDGQPYPMGSPKVPSLF